MLGVPGINYSTLLDRSKDFEQFRTILCEHLPGAAVDRSALIAFAQLLWDQTDPSGHVRHTTADPYPNTPPKKILYQVAFGDHQVAPVTVEIAARSNGASIHTPVLEPGKVVPEVTPYYGIPPIAAYPFDGSAVVIWDSGNPAPPDRERAAAGDRADRPGVGGSLAVRAGPRLGPPRVPAARSPRRGSRSRSS